MYKITRLNGRTYSFHDYPSLDAFIKAGLDHSKSHPENARLIDSFQGTGTRPEWLGVTGGS